MHYDSIFVPILAAILPQVCINLYLICQNFYLYQFLCFACICLHFSLYFASTFGSIFASRFCFCICVHASTLFLFVLFYSFLAPFSSFFFFVYIFTFYILLRFVLCFWSILACLGYFGYFLPLFFPLYLFCIYSCFYFPLMPILPIFCRHLASIFVSIFDLKSVRIL